MNKTSKKTINKVIKICTAEGWGVFEGDQDLEISQYSPAGEDFSFSVSKDNLIYNIIEYACNFDPDEHAEMWIEGRGTRGIPSSVRVLIDDADAIAEMLESLADKLRGLDNE